jgi:hypothetical protein
MGPGHFDKLYLADRLSAQVRTIGIVTWFVAVWLVASLTDPFASLPSRSRHRRQPLR